MGRFASVGFFVGCVLLPGVELTLKCWCVYMCGASLMGMFACCFLSCFFVVAGFRLFFFYVWGEFSDDLNKKSLS